MLASGKTKPVIARIWRGRTTRDTADAYAASLHDEGVKPLTEKALGVQQLREDGETESEFITISYLESVEAMARFTGGDPAKIHHLPRDGEFLIEPPQRVQVTAIATSHGNAGGTRD